MAEFRDWIVEYFPGVSGTTGIELNNVVNLRVTRTLNAKTNSVELSLSNYRGACLSGGEVKYKPDEIIKVYASTGIVDKTNTDHLIGVYQIQDYDINSVDGTVKIKGQDKTYNMLAKLYTASREEPVNDIVENIVDTINEDGVTATPIVKDVASTDSSGSAFVTKKYSSVYKTAYDAISELSQSEYTGDKRTYIYWFDETDKFYWQYPGQTPEVTEFEWAGGDIVSMKSQKSESETIAMIIYNAGNDKNDVARLGFFLDPNAGSIKNRMKYQPMTDISRDLKVELERAGEYAAITNDDYNDLLDERARSRAKVIVDKVGQGLWESSVEIYGTKYTPGGLYPVIDTINGLPRTNLRLESVIHTMNKKGWVTTLKLKEDPAEIEV